MLNFLSIISESFQIQFLEQFFLFIIHRNFFLMIKIIFKFHLNFFKVFKFVNFTLLLFIIIHQVLFFVLI